MTTKRTASRDISELVSQLTLDEKATLLAGAGLWSTAAIERLGIPAVGLCDGPNGARGAAIPASFGGAPVPAFCFPCGAAIGATWDAPLAERVGQAIGTEARSKACRVLLAPTVNLHRSPLGGRNFESYSEDPIHAGRIGAAFVRGAQSAGVATTVKHFAGNESEKHRLVADSRIDERTLREVHLVPFELTVREGGTLGMMTAYNRLNGTHCADDGVLLQDLLRDTWGFEGFVVTDWHALADTAAAIVAGLDLEMPGPGRAYGPALATAVRDGRVDEADVDTAVTRLLAVLDRIGALDDEPAEPRVDGRPAHRAVARETVAASAVLLENEGVLPRQTARLRRVALIGPNAARLRVMGGGSASLSTATPPRSLFDALTERLPDATVLHEVGVDIELATPTIPGDQLTARDGAPGMSVDVFDVDDIGGESRSTLHVADGCLLTFSTRSSPCVVPYAAVGEARLRVGEAGRYVVSLVHTGRAALYLDGDLLIDSRHDDHAPGSENIGLASREEQAIVELSLDRDRHLRVELWQEEAGISHGFRIGIRAALDEDAFDRAIEAAATSDTVIVVVGATEEFDAEINDRVSTTLPGRQTELVERVLDVAPDAIVIINTGSVVLMPWAPRCQALLHAWLGGEEMADGLADVLLGDAEPGGRLPTTIPLRIEDSPTFGNDYADNGVVIYGERLNVGHRWYDARKLDVAYPFGFGRSYTTFDVSDPALSCETITADGTITVTCRVTNTGARRGSEVVQLYVSPPRGPVFRPIRELKGFRKVTLDPGESAEVAITLDARSFAHWQPPDPALDRLTRRVKSLAPWNGLPEGRQHEGWVVRRGTYGIVLGRSSRDFDHELVVVVPITFAIPT